MPEIKMTDVYYVSTFSNDTKKIIKTVESSRSISDKQEIIPLLEKSLIDEHRVQEYKYIHLGLI